MARVTAQLTLIPDHHPVTLYRTVVQFMENAQRNHLPITEASIIEYCSRAIPQFSAAVVRLVIKELTQPAPLVAR